MRWQTPTLLFVLLLAACGGGTPTAPHPGGEGGIQPPPVPPPPPPLLKRIAIGETVEVALSGSVFNGPACEMGNDPFPCTSLGVDVPRDGTVVIRVDFDTDVPMFMSIGDLAIGNPLSLVAGASPIIGQARVRRGLLPFRVGINVPWGLRDVVVTYRVTATME